MSTLEIHFDGTTACLGYDCWFQLSHAGLGVYPQDGECVVALYSREDTHPLRVLLHIYNPEELRTLISGLAKALAQMTTREEERTMSEQHERFRCTKETPWNPAIPGPVEHTATHEVGEQRDGYPGGDLITIECHYCKHRWEQELPQ